MTTTKKGHHFFQVKKGDTISYRTQVTPTLVMPMLLKGQTYKSADSSDSKILISAESFYYHKIRLSIFLQLCKENKRDSYQCRRASIALPVAQLAHKSLERAVFNATVQHSTHTCQSQIDVNNNNSNTTTNNNNNPTIPAYSHSTFIFNLFLCF